MVSWDSIGCWVAADEVEGLVVWTEKVGKLDSWGKETTSWMLSNSRPAVLQRKRRPFCCTLFVALTMCAHSDVT
jgi:hypothetical protein